jgi:hydroxyacylglutathione hydrolase
MTRLSASDHAGGNLELQKMFPHIKIYGFDDRIPGLTHKISHNEEFYVGSLRVQVIHNPCHTSGSLSYIIHEDGAEPSARAVFTGDTLFIAGCGRFFEGTAEQMAESLLGKLGKLPPSTSVFPGHEYTISNLEVSDRIRRSSLVVCCQRRSQ